MVQIKKCAGLIYGKMAHHLDHIAPLCALMQIPLIVTEEEIAASARRFYPEIEVITADYLACPEFTVSRFDLLFYSIPRDLFDEIFFLAQTLLQKKVHTIWCPHGNSDKGQSIYHMEALHKEETALVYGKQMIDFLQRKNVFNQLKSHVITSNYRYEIYLKNKAFYDDLAEREIARRLPAQAGRTILYAPTWQDYEQSCSFFDAMPPLAEQLPADRNLIVKLHPNLLENQDLLVEEILDRYRSKDNILFLFDFPPIYPLLNLADVYLGDMSSIGYDFLAFDRPMFFLNQNARDPLYLFRCGIEIKKEDYDKIYQKIDNYFHFELRPFSEIRKDVYTYAFGHCKPLETLKEEIEKMLERIAETDMGFYA